MTSTSVLFQLASPKFSSSSGISATKPSGLGHVGAHGGDGVVMAAAWQHKTNMNINMLETRIMSSLRVAMYIDLYLFICSHFRLNKKSIPKA
jgi:hypothetical protein